MKKKAFAAWLVFVPGCLTLRPYQVRPIALSGNEIRVVQSKYTGLTAIPKYYTRAETLKIEVVFEKTYPSVTRTVLWFRREEGEPWRRGPASEEGGRWIVFRPPEGRFLCRASLMDATGTEHFVPGPDSQPSFVLNVDRTPPTVKLLPLEKVLANTTTSVRFEVWDAALGPAPKGELYLSTDGGASWKRIGVIDIELGENSFSWKVPPSAAESAVLRLVCRDLAGNETRVESSRPFAILPHPTPKEALERFIFGVKPPEKRPPQEAPSSPSRETAQKPGSGPAPLEHVVPGNLSLHAPKAVRPGESVTIPIEGLPDSLAGRRVRLLWQPSPQEAWQETGALLLDNRFTWKAPYRETFQGRLRAEVIDAEGRPIASGTAGPLVVDGTPPAVTVETGNCTESPVCSVLARAADTGAGTEWIRLYISRDGGNTWTPKSERSGPELELSIARENVSISLFAQARDKAGNTSAAPKPGGIPHAVIPPLSSLRVVLNELETPLYKGGQRIHLTWSITGSVAEGTTAALSLRDSPDGPWKSVGQVELAAQRFLWEIPDRTIPHLWLRLEIKLPSGAVVPSNSVGPYAVDSDPPSVVLHEPEVYASSTARFEVQSIETGPAPFQSATVYVRPAEGGMWKVLQSSWDGKVLSVPSLQLPEGRYEIYIACTDQVGNSCPPPGEKTPGSATLIVDKTPPRPVIELNESYVEGVEGPFKITLPEPAEIQLFYRAEGARAETCLGRFSVPAGTTAQKLRFPPGATNGAFWVTATDKAGNRGTSSKQTVKVKPAVRFVTPHPEESFRPGVPLSVQFTVDPSFLALNPTLSLWWNPQPGATRRLVAKELHPAKPFTWTVPDSPGSSHSLAIEGRVEGVLRALAVSPLFQISKEGPLAERKSTKAALVSPLSRERSAEGIKALNLLSEALRTGETEKVQALRDAAEREFRAALAIDPNNDEALLGLARLRLKPLAEQEDLGEAERYLKQAVDRNPSNRDAWSHLGVVRLRLKKYPEAESALGRALNLGSQSDPVTRYNLGLALMQQKKYGPALDQFRFALRSKQSARWAYPCMIDCYLGLGQPLKAQEVLSEAERKGAIDPQQAAKWKRYLEAKLTERR